MNHTSIAYDSLTKPAPNVIRRFLRQIRRKLGFVTFVAIPTLVSAIYYGFFAAPQYVSEAQFIVKGQTSQPSSMLAGLFEGGAGGGTSEDTYAVQDYVTSRDAALLMIKNYNIKNIYNNKNSDFLSRFPNFYSGETFEHFYNYYKSHIIAELDTTTGVSTLQVRTFSAEDSQKIARALLVAAENLINKMNDRQTENTISSSKKELNYALSKLDAVNKKIDYYRNQVAMINPSAQSQSVLKDIASLQTNIIATKISLSQLQNSTPNSPLIDVYKRRLESLNLEISHVENSITGSDKSFVPKISGYDALIFQRTLLEKEVGAADAAVANAKLQADRQLLYLNEITEPNLPDYASRPRSLANIAIVFGTTFGLYLMVMLLISGAREHKLV